MILHQFDITIIQELLGDYQYYTNNYPHFFAETAGQFVSPRKVYPWISLQAKLDYYGLMVSKALSGEHPTSFDLLKTKDDQWLAWSYQTATYGPTTEFQARLWAFQQRYLYEAIEDGYKCLDHTVRDELTLSDDKVSAWAKIWKDVFEGLSVAPQEPLMKWKSFQSTPKPENPFYRLMHGNITDNLIDEIWDKPEREGRE